MLCSVVTENSNWEILTKNLVTLKVNMGWGMKNFGGSRKNRVLGGGGYHENQ